MTAKLTTTPQRKSPMSRLEVERLRNLVLALVAKKPTGCVAMAKRFGFHQKTMMNHLRHLQQLGRIHAKPATEGRRTEYLWHLGAGDCVSRTYKPKPGREAVVKQHTVTTWPPLSIPKQHIWSAVMG